MFRKIKRNIDVPEQPFVKDVDLDVSVSHPLMVRKFVRLIVYVLLGAFCIAGGVFGLNRPFEDTSQQSANYAAASLFFVIGLFFLVLAFFIFRTKVVVKEVKSAVIGVWVGFRKNIVYLDSRQVYKGKNKHVRVVAGNRIILVNIKRRSIYFE